MPGLGFWVGILNLIEDCGNCAVNRCRVDRLSMEGNLLKAWNTYVMLIEVLLYRRAILSHCSALKTSKSNISAIDREQRDYAGATTLQGDLDAVPYPPRDCSLQLSRTVYKYLTTSFKGHFLLPEFPLAVIATDAS
jgi:hypothetical protein